MKPPRIDNGAHPCEANCGLPVSGNKRWCMTCVELKARASVAAKEEEPMDNTTHILVKKDGVHRGGPIDGTAFKSEDLYRADGMLIAARQDDVVRFGRDISTAQSQIFLNGEFAAKFLRRLCDVDLICQVSGEDLKDIINDYTSELRCPRASVIEERDGDFMELGTDEGGKILLATPGNTKSLKLN